MSTDTTKAPKKPASPKPAPSGARESIAREIFSGSWLVSVLSIVIALVIGAILIAVSNADVQATLGYFFARPGDFFAVAWNTIAEAYLALFRGAVFDWQAANFSRSIRPLTESFVYASPLIFTGLGMTLAFRSGLFNIGGQGQVVVGAIVSGFFGYAFHLPTGLHVLVALLGGLLAGALWASIAGVLKARTGANEVIVTIMLNSISGYLLSYLLKNQWFTQTGQNTPISTQVDDSAALAAILPAPFRLHWGFLLAILATWAVWWLLERSTIGFEFRAVGANPDAARTAGISVGRVTILVMACAGALAGLGGSMQSLGTERQLAEGIGGSIGFDAITVALLGRSRPIGTFFAGLLFGAFKAGGYLMQAQTGTPIEIILVVQSVIVLLIAAPPLVRAIFRLPAPAPKKEQA